MFRFFPVRNKIASRLSKSPIVAAVPVVPVVVVNNPLSQTLDAVGAFRLSTSDAIVDTISLPNTGGRDAVVAAALVMQ